MKKKNALLVLLFSFVLIFSCSSFTFATEADSVHVSLVKYSGSDRLDEHDEYDGTTVTIEDETYPVLANVVFNLYALEGQDYVLIEENLTTNEDGYLTVSGLSPDKEYYFQETAPAEGFILEDSYVKAIPWTTEEIITYAVSTMKELPPDEYLDEELDENFEEEEAVAPEDESATSATEDESADTETPPTGDNTMLLVFCGIMLCTAIALFAWKKVKN